MKNTKLIALLLALTTAASLAGCGSSGSSADDTTATEAESSEAAEDAEEAEGGDSAEAREIIVAAAPGYYPITYADDNGEAAGYDVEVFKAIDELLEDYTFTYEIADKETMNVGVQTGTYQVGINSLFKTEERLETYNMPENNLGYTAVGIIQREDSNYTSLQDLYDQQARIYATGTSGGVTNVIDTWNEEHPDAQLDVERRSDVVYADSLAAVQAGESDALIQLIPVFNLVDESAKVGLKMSDPIDVIPTFCIVNKDETDLNAQIDEALGQLREDGTLSALSEEFFGYDVFAVGE